MPRTIIEIVVRKHLVNLWIHWMTQKQTITGIAKREHPREWEK